MAWNEAKAYVTATGAAVRVGVQQIGKGNPRLMVSLGAELYEQLGEPDSVNVFVGDGDDAGKLLLQFDEDGAVEFKAAKKGGGQHSPECSPGNAQDKNETCRCQIRGTGSRRHRQQTNQHHAALVAA